MSEPFIEAFAICRKVERDDTGVNLYGIFSDIYISTIPGTTDFYSFFAVNREDLEPGEEYEFKLEVHQTDTSRLFVSGEWQTIEHSTETRGTNITTQIKLLFRQLGSYDLRFMIRRVGTAGAGREKAKVRFRVKATSALITEADSELKTPSPEAVS